MRLAADQDALDFAANIRELLADVADAAALRVAWDDPDGRIPGVWKRLAEAGVLGLTVPEEYGGSGADFTTLVPVLVEAGRAALPEPLVETTVAAALVARAGGDLAAEWLPRVVAGTAVLAAQLHPSDTMVSAAPWADLVLMRGPEESLVAVTGDEMQLASVEQSVDRGVRLALVGVSNAEPVAGADREAGFDMAAVAVAAQLTGLADAMLEMSVRYAKQREQFGVVIGSFQAVKHQLADAYVANEFAKPVVARAAWSVAQDASTRARDASHAKYAASVAARRAARTALQVHAGIGYTYEHDLHIWMKRTWTLSSLWGTKEWHRERVAKAVLDR